MKIFLLRHGTAEDATGVVADFERRLIAKGQEQARQVAELLVAIGERPDRVLASPLRRARETAEAVVRRLGGDLRITIEERLAPGTPIEAIAAAVCAKGASAVLAVGHEPSLSRLAAHLAGADELRLELKKGGLVELELEGEPARAVLLGLLRPGHLRRSARS